MGIIFIILSILLIVSNFIFRWKYSNSHNATEIESNDYSEEEIEQIEEEDEEEEEAEDMEFESEFPTRAENAHVIYLLFTMYNESNPMTADQTERKNLVVDKCLELAKRYIDEIYDETIDTRDNSEDQN